MVVVCRRIKAAALNKTKLLRTLPNLGPVEPYMKDLYNEGHRYLLIPPHYKIIYLVYKEQNAVLITDIFDTRQNPEKMKP